jgi:hypothetical protein
MRPEDAEEWLRLLRKEGFSYVRKALKDPQWSLPEPKQSPPPPNPPDEVAVSLSSDTGSKDQKKRTVEVIPPRRENAAEEEDSVNAEETSQTEDPVEQVLIEKVLDRDDHGEFSHIHIYLGDKSELGAPSHSIRCRNVCYAAISRKHADAITEAYLCK